MKAEVGEPLCVVWESVNLGRRTIWIVMQRATLPTVRMTQRSKWVDARAREYLAWKAATADYVIAAMLAAGIKSFADRVRLKLWATFSLAPRAITVVQANGKEHARTTHPAEKADLNNLVKAIEDAMQGVLYTNDKDVFAYGGSEKREADEDETELRFEEMA